MSILFSRRKTDSLSEGKQRSMMLARRECSPGQVDARRGQVDARRGQVGNTGERGDTQRNKVSEKPRGDGVLIITEGLPPWWEKGFFLECSCREAGEDGGRYQFVDFERQER